MIKSAASAASRKTKSRGPRYRETLRPEAVRLPSRGSRALSKLDLGPLDLVFLKSALAGNLIMALKSLQRTKNIHGLGPWWVQIHVCIIKGWTTLPQRLRCQSTYSQPRPICLNNGPPDPKWPTRSKKIKNPETIILAPSGLVTPTSSGWGKS